MYRFKLSSITILLLACILLAPAGAPVFSQAALDNPPAPAGEDVLPAPLALRAPANDPLRSPTNPQIGARAFDPYQQTNEAAPSWQRWPYGSPDPTFGYLYDVAWTPAVAGQTRQAWAVGFTTDFQGTALHWDGRSWQRTPLPGGAGMIGHVSVISANDVWAAGDAFLHWDGSAWSIGGRLQPGVADIVLTLQMLSPTLGFAGTFKGYIYTWDGSDWTRGDQISGLDVQTLHMFDANNGWAAGQQGVILRCQNGVWSRVYSPVSHSFISMSFISPNDGWLVGTGGTFLHWDGAAWTPVFVPGATATVGISMRTPTDGWAVGELGKVFHWDGRSWTAVQVEDAEGILLMSVSAASSSSAFMVGTSGALLQWDGRAWKVVPLTARMPLWIRDARMTAANDGWAVGGAGLLLRWDGQDWQTQTPIEGNPTLLSIDMFGPRALWMAGAGGLVYGEGDGEWRVWEVPAVFWSVDAVPIENQVFAAGNNGAEKPLGVIYTLDDEDWRKMDIPTQTPALYGIKMYSAGFGFAVGAQGTILRWDGATQTWSPVGSPTGDTLLSVEFVSRTDWWAVGTNGTILHGDGENWTRVDSPLPGYQLCTVRMTNLKLSTNNDIWISGEQGALLHYNWDTHAWDVVPSSTTNTLTGLAGDLDGTAWAFGANGTIVHYGPTYTMTGRVTDALSGTPLPGIELRAGTNVSVRTDADGVYRFTLVPSSTYEITLATPGYTYAPTQRSVTVPPDATGLDFTARRANSWKCWPGDEPFACAPNLFSVASAGNGRGWAVGEDGVIFLWDGARWLRVPSPANLTLRSVTATSWTDAWAVGGGGTVLHWDGRVWSTVDAGAAVNLGAVAALAPNDVWIAGQEGLIRHWNGATWQTVPSGTDDIIRTLSMLSPTEGWAAGGHVDAQTGAATSFILHWNGQTWSQVFSPVDKPITAISMLSPTLGWAVGVDGIVRWNGSYWALDPAAERGVFTGLAMRSPTEGWAIGSHAGHPAAMHWNGQTWEVSTLDGESVQTIAYLSADEQIIVGLVGVTGRRQGAGAWEMRVPHLGNHGASVDALSADDIWLATSGGDVLRWDGTRWDMQTQGVAGAGYVLRAYADDDVWLGAANGFVGHWDGTQWTNLGEPTDKLINNIMKIGPNEIWAAGGRFVQQNKIIIPYPELMRWDGSAWTRPNIGDVQTMFSGMINFGPNDIWVAGYDNHILHWDGHAWVDSSFGGDYILSMAGRAPNDIWGVGIEGRIVHYDGSGWGVVASPTEEQLGDIKLLPDGTGWAVGWDMVYFDGQQWRKVQSPTGKLLMSLTLLSEHEGWAVGAEGVKLRLGPAYSASGLVADTQGNPIAGVEVFNSQSQVAFSDVDGSYRFDDLAGGSITITPTLKGWTFDPPARTFSAPPAPEDINFVGRPLTKTYLPLMGAQPAGLVGWTIGNYTEDGGVAIVHTVNGGRLWLPQTARGQWAGYSGLDISAVDSKTAWAALGAGPDAEPGRILHTTNGGATWVKQPLPAGVNEQVKGVVGLTRNIAWAVTLQGTIMRTTNGGASWSVVPHPGITMTEVNRIDAIAPHDVWVVDHTSASGVIHTTDNGVTWRRETLSGVEPGAGPLAINAFSPTVVWASVAGQSDFHRTTDGGAHWSRVVPGLAGGNDFDDICAASEDTIFGALNQGGFIGGNIFRVHLNPSGPPDVSDFVSQDYVVAGATCMNERTAWVVGNRAMDAAPELPAGVIFHATDGVNWQPQITLVTDAAWWKISMVGAHR